MCFLPLDHFKLTKNKCRLTKGVVVKAVRLRNRLGRFEVKAPTVNIPNRGNLPGVNFTNILCAAFSYESFARSFFVLEVKVKLFIGARKLAQLRYKVSVKLIPGLTLKVT